ncbi:MAG: TonB family protein [Bacteroidota bacterium]
MSNFLFELAIVHAVLILAYWFLLRKERHYGRLRHYLLGATVLAIGIPLLKLPRLVGSNPVQPMPVPVTDNLPTEPISTLPLETPTLWYMDWLVGIYLTVSGLLLLKLLYNVGYLILLEKKSRYEKYQEWYVRKVSGVAGSFTFFRWIFLSDAIDKQEADYEIILKHEEAHVRLRHTYDLFLIELFKVCFWWLPTAWFVNKEIRKIHEYQADAYALKSCSYDRYSTILISSTLTMHGLGLASSFHDGAILKRLQAMKQQTKKVSPWKLGALASLCALLVVALACTEDQSEVADVDSLAETTAESATSFEIVEEQPQPAGGAAGFYGYVANEIKYPLQARNQGIEGRVFLTFTVEKDGSLTGIQVKKGIGAGCDEEAIRVLKNAPPFTPGKQRGRAVRVQMDIPITFKINPEGENSDGSAQGIVIIDEVQTNTQKLKVDANYEDGAWVGTVYSEEGKTLPGVNISIPGTSVGTVSDLFGKFKLPAEENQAWQVSFVGFETLQFDGK